MKDGLVDVKLLAPCLRLSITVTVFTDMMFIYAVLNAAF